MVAEEMRGLIKNGFWMGFRDVSKAVVGKSGKAKQDK